MLHKFEKMLGLPEDSLAYEEEVRKEMAYYKKVVKSVNPKTREKRNGRNN